MLNRSRCNWHILFLLPLLVAGTTARAQITNKTPPAEPSVAKTLDLDRDTQTIAFMGDSITHMGEYQEALKLQELIYDRKASLEKDVRAMAVKGQEGWFDGPIDEEQKQIDQQIREYQSKDRLRGWTSYILKTASDAFGHREQIFAELREIRKTLAERPEQTVYRYELSPVSASE